MAVLRWRTIFRAEVVTLLIHRFINAQCLILAQNNQPGFVLHFDLHLHLGIAARFTQRHRMADLLNFELKGPGDFPRPHAAVLFLHGQRDAGMSGICRVR